MARFTTRRQVVLLLVAVLFVGAVIGARHRGANCAAAPFGAAPASAGPQGGQLIRLLEGGTCPQDGQVAFALRDDTGAPMEVLDPVADPRGGYLGVYHTSAAGHAAADARGYELVLAHSDDLLHWRRLRVLDGGGASMGTLQPVPGGNGFLLAYEKAPAQTGHFIRVCYYAQPSALQAGRASACRALPRTLSALNEGTPSLLSIRWNGGLDRSVIELAFHYELTAGQGAGADREALGVLTGFRRFSALPDQTVDAALTRAGFAGSHGDQRQFAYGGQTWSVYEANTTASGFASWFSVLYAPSSRAVYPLAFRTTDGVLPRSFGNPVVEVLPAPGGHGRVLAMTLFVFSAGPAARLAGELIFYRPL